MIGEVPNAETPHAMQSARLPISRTTNPGLHVAPRWFRQSFALNGLFDAIPHARTWVFHWHKKLRHLGDIAQVSHQIGAHLTNPQVLLLFFAAPAVDDLRQDLLKFRTRHDGSFLP